MKHKKGAEKYFSIWWFFVLVIITGGIVAGVSLFNIRDVDVRGLESDILVSRTVDCIVENGQIKEEVLTGDFNVLEKCGFSEELIKDSGKYSLNIYIYDSGGEKLESYHYGVRDFENQCKLEGKHYPKCSEKIISVLRGNEVLKLKILTGSNQKGGRFEI